MRRIIALLILGRLVSLSFGQYVETTILLPDSASGLTNVQSLVYHSPTHTIYVGGDESLLVAANAQTTAKLKRVVVGMGPHVLCSDPPGNKVYCSNDDATITVVDGATNQPIEKIPVEQSVTDLVYCESENKLYCGNASDSFVRVVDCAADSVVARIPAGPKPSSLCYSPRLNRLYCAIWLLDEVAVIDCETDTVITNVWVRGVEPRDICYDSATNCVYTANGGSNSVSVMDCAGDSVLRLVPVGLWPALVVTGPPGKVYCANNGDSVSVILVSGVKTVHTGNRPIALSFDPANNKVYCASYYWDSVTVIDAARDTVLAQVDAGSYPAALCYNPAGNNTFVACNSDDVVSVIGGVSDTVEAVIAVGACNPGPLCYSTSNNHLYCLDRSNGQLFVIDGESNLVLRTLNAGSAYYGSDTLVWNPVSNKCYFTNSDDSTVSILDCASDSIVATLVTGVSPVALCCSDSGRVYVVNEGGGVAVIDGSGDSVRTVVPINDYPRLLSYDRTDNKVYVGGVHGDTVSVIDAGGDTVVASILVPSPYRTAFCWNQNHDKLYVSTSDSMAVIDCASDTVLSYIRSSTVFDLMYSDSACDKVYGVYSWDGYLFVIQAAVDSFFQVLAVQCVTALLDNAKPGPANRLYCTSTNAGEVVIVAGHKTDRILRRISVGGYAVALAWNPTYSRMYVSNSGSSSISVIRDTFGVSVEEGQLQASSRKPQAAVVRGVLSLIVDSRQQQGYRAELLDAAGRRVMGLKPGANDVRALAPGVYFVREGPQAAIHKPQAVSKIVITR